MAKTLTEQQLFAKLFREMKKRPGIPFLSHSREILQQHMPDIRAKYPQAKLYVYGELEYTCLTPEAEERMLVFLEQHVKDLEQKLADSKQTLAQAIAQKGGT